MRGLRGNKEARPAVSADFQHALMQQVLRTELIRIKALIGTTALLTIMLKGAGLENLQYDAIALIALMGLAMTIAVTRFRRTLD